MNSTLSDDERKFLHDLASPLGTALFSLDALSEKLQERLDVPPDESILLGSVKKALEQMRIQLMQRRDVLIKRGAPGAKG